MNVTLVIREINTYCLFIHKSYLLMTVSERSISPYVYIL